MRHDDAFAGDYNIDTPESVAVDFEIADLGNRFLAALVDTTLIIIAIIGLGIVTFFLLDAVTPDSGSVALDEGDIGWIGGLFIALYAILSFFVFWGYYILLELSLNGQTVGKRLVHIRVVRTDGGPAGAVEIVVRNLVRLIDLLPAAYMLGFITMVANRQARRLGDFAAGTIVVKSGGKITLDSLLATYAPQPVRTSLDAALAPQGGRAPSPPAAPELDVRAVRPADYALINETLGRAASQKLDEALVARLAVAIAGKVGYTLRTGEDPRDFLSRVAAAYRTREK